MNELIKPFFLYREAIRLGGTCTGEHGIGRGKIKFLQKEYDTVSLEVMKKIKQTIDPKNLFNPGKVLIIP